MEIIIALQIISIILQILSLSKGFSYAPMVILLNNIIIIILCLTILNLRQ